MESFIDLFFFEGKFAHLHVCFSGVINIKNTHTLLIYTHGETIIVFRSFTNSFIDPNLIMSKIYMQGNFV